MRQEVYKSTTGGDIPLSFTGRHLLQTLREAITKAIMKQNWHEDADAISRAREAIARYISDLERKGNEMALARLERVKEQVQDYPDPYNDKDGSIARESEFQSIPPIPVWPNLAPDPKTREEGVRQKHNHYHKDVSKLDFVDVYRICQLFNVTDPCIQHALKKLLVAGGRGAGKDIGKDIQESIDSLTRWQEMRKEESSNVPTLETDNVTWRTISLHNKSCAYEKTGTQPCDCGVWSKRK